MKAAKTALLLILISMTIGEVTSLYSLLSSGFKLSSAVNYAPPAIIQTVALLLEAAGVLILVASKRNKATITALIFLALWAVLNFLVFLPLTLIGVRSGSLEAVKAALLVKAVAATLQYAVPFLVVYSETKDFSRKILWLALITVTIGGFMVTSTPISSIKLKTVNTSKETLYIPVYRVNYTQWPYPLYLTLCHIGGILYLITYALVIIKYRENSLSDRPENSS
ncbi:MAG: hypothetical protein DRJ63_09740 [Thermoprotei archaeon]|nr:MAG: hypothetical protein DRJ63_09740 [Thermoprotei archaeon]